MIELNETRRDVLASVCDTVGLAIACVLDPDDLFAPPGYEPRRAGGRMATARPRSRRQSGGRLRRPRPHPRRWALVQVWNGAVLATFADEAGARKAMSRANGDEVVVLNVE